MPVPPGHEPAFAFPAAETLAATSEADLRTCKMGFRAPYLRATAIAVAKGQFDPTGLSRLSRSDARTALMELEGVDEAITVNEKLNA